MDRYHMIKPVFCLFVFFAEIQRQVSKYITMEIGHSVDY